MNGYATIEEERFHRQVAEERIVELKRKVEKLRQLMIEAVRDFHGKSVLFSATFLEEAEHADR